MLVIDHHISIVILLTLWGIALSENKIHGCIACPLRDWVFGPGNHTPKNLLNMGPLNHTRRILDIILTKCAFMGSV